MIHLENAKVITNIVLQNEKKSKINKHFYLDNRYKMVYLPTSKC